MNLTKNELDAQKSGDNLVAKEVLQNQNALVNELLENEFFSYDDIENLYQKITKDEVLELVEPQIDGEDFKKLEKMTDEQVLNQYDQEVQEMIDKQEPQEIFEWWLVSDWLLERLEEQGEPILKTDFGNWWGRTCTGQAIALDHNIQEIAQKAGF